MILDLVSKVQQLGLPVYIIDITLKYNYISNFYFYMTC